MEAAHVPGPADRLRKILLAVDRGQPRYALEGAVILLRDFGRHGDPCCAHSCLRLHEPDHVRNPFAGQSPSGAVRKEIREREDHSTKAHEDQCESNESVDVNQIVKRARVSVGIHAKGVWQAHQPDRKQAHTKNLQHDPSTPAPQLSPQLSLDVHPDLLAYLAFSSGAKRWRPIVAGGPGEYIGFGPQSIDIMCFLVLCACEPGSGEPTWLSRPTAPCGSSSRASARRPRPRTAARATPPGSP
jgi:hypothetical protein